MTKEEALLKRFQTLENGFWTIHFVVINGEVQFWLEPVKQKIEGFQTVSEPVNSVVK